MVARDGPDGYNESDGEISERAAKKRRTEQDEQDVEQQGEAEDAPRQDGAQEGEDVAAEDVQEDASGRSATSCRLRSRPPDKAGVSHASLYPLAISGVVQTLCARTRRGVSTQETDR